MPVDNAQAASNATVAIILGFIFSLLGWFGLDVPEGRRVARARGEDCDDPRDLTEIALKNELYGKGFRPNKLRKA
jgi:hypothetical protein